MNTNLRRICCSLVGRQRWRWLQIMTVFLSISGGTACVRYIPRPLEPTAEVRALLERSFIPPLLTVSLTTTPTASEWVPLATQIDVSNGLNLGEANSLALFYSPELAAARAEAKIASAQLLSAGLLSNPELFAGPRFVNGGGVIFPASASIQIPLPGQLSTNEQRFKALSEEKKWEVAARELSVLVALQEKFVSARIAKAKSDALSQLSTVSSEVLKWADTLYGSREIDSLSFHLARLNRSEIETQYREQLLAYDKALLEVQTLIGVVPSERIVLEELPPLPSLKVDEGKEHEGVLNLPLARATLASYQQAEAALKVEVLRQYPRFSFGPEFESDQGQTSIGFGVGLTLPIFNTNRGPIKEAEERREAARLRHRAVLLELFQAKKRAEFDKESAESLIAIVRSQTLPAAEAAASAIRSRLSTGVTNILEVVAVQRSLMEAKVREAELEGQVNIATFRLAAATGAIFQNDPNSRNSGK